MTYDLFGANIFIHLYLHVKPMLLIRSRAQEVRAVIRQSEGCRFDPALGVPKAIVGPKPQTVT